MEDLKQFERDQLIEVISIGAGNASTALSQLVHRKITLSVPEIFIDRVERFPMFLGDSEKMMTAILIKILGDAPGMMFMLFSPENALRLAGLLTDKLKKYRNVLEDIDLSALQEIGNILSGTAMTALSQFFNLNLIQSVPDAASGMLGAVMDSVIAEIGQISDIVLAFKVRFSVQGDNISGELFFIFDPGSTAKILETTKRKIPHYYE